MATVPAHGPSRLACLLAAVTDPPPSPPAPRALEARLERLDLAQQHGRVRHEHVVKAVREADEVVALGDLGIGRVPPPRTILGHALRFRPQDQDHALACGEPRRSGRAGGRGRSRAVTSPPLLQAVAVSARVERRFDRAHPLKLANLRQPRPDLGDGRERTHAGDRVLEGAAVCRGNLRQAPEIRRRREAIELVSTGDG